MESAIYQKRHEGYLSVDSLRYLLYIFIVLFMVSGGILLVVEFLTAPAGYLKLVASFTYTGVMIMLGSACIAAFISGVFGMSGVEREARWPLVMYAVMLVLIFLVGLIGGLSALTGQGRMERQILVGLPQTFANSYGLEIEEGFISRNVSADIETIQREVKCCGGKNYTDWKISWWKRQRPWNNNTVPDSCCRLERTGCGLQEHVADIYHSGCAEPVKNHIIKHLVIMGILSFILATLTIPGIFVSILLYMQLKEIDKLLKNRRSVVSNGNKSWSN